ncbi:MAG: shikimate dehydrogenase [Pseudomonadota bacterium]
MSVSKNKSATEPANGHRAAAVIGWPITHSKSPAIHTHWLKEHQIDGHYGALAVRPEDANAFFADFKSQNLVGANVTIPHKETVFRHLDYVDGAAKEIGAVNTIWTTDGGLSGTNTDWIGFQENLNDHAPGWQTGGKTAVVLGAGGAARGVVYALKQNGFTEIIVANRTRARADEFKARFGDSIVPVALDDVEDHLAHASLLINTTSLGMEGHPPLTLSLERLDRNALVTDIVYTPLTTPLLALAKTHGHVTVDGLGMLLHQAVPGFERWFGVKPVVTHTLRQLILKEMGLDA